MAPTVSMEQLIYATRLMNVASKESPDSARTLRDWWTKSDASLDPQAYILRPDVVLELSATIINEPTTYLRTRRAALATTELLRKAVETGEFTLSRMENRWLTKLSNQADELPEDESQFIAQMVQVVDREKVRLEEYEIEV